MQLVAESEGAEHIIVRRRGRQGQEHRVPARAHTVIPVAVAALQEVAPGEVHVQERVEGRGGHA